MSKVTFRSRQQYFTLMHELLFPECATMVSPFMFSETSRKMEIAVTGDKLEEIQKLPDWEMIGAGYSFSEGKNHNEFTTEKEVVIEAMRTYIKSRNDDFIEEIDKIE